MFRMLSLAIFEVSGLLLASSMKILTPFGMNTPNPCAVSISTTIPIQNTSPFNVYGWPTISVPCGFAASGLPIGLQISGPPGRDAVVLQVAHAYEQATQWHKRVPKTA